MPNKQCFDTSSTDLKTAYAHFLPMKLTLEGSYGSLEIPSNRYLKPIVADSPVLCFALQKHNLSTIRLGASLIHEESSLMFDFNSNQLLIYSLTCEALTREYVNYRSISAKEIKNLLIAIFIVVGIVGILIVYLIIDCLFNQPPIKSPK